MTEITRSNTYKPADLDELRGHEQESTSDAINTIAKHAGTTRTYDIHGNDRTEREIHDERRGSLGQAAKDVVKDALKEGVPELLGHFAGHGATASIGVAGATAFAFGAAAVYGTLALMHEVGEDGIAGQERAEAMVKDTLHCFLLANLNGVPADWRDAELAKYPKSAQDYKNNHLFHNLIDRLGKGDNRFMLIAQHHCDEGMLAAQRVLTGGVSAADQRDIDRRLDDPAFKYGYEAMMHASRNPETYKAVVEGLRERNAWYQQAQLQVRG